MSKKSGFGKLLAGVGIGAALGLLFAPKSGKETREDLKVKGTELINKAKDIDLEEVKDNLIKEFENLKAELADMDMEKAKKIAKKKGKEIQKKANELIEVAKEKGTPVIEKAAKDVKKNLIIMVVNKKRKRKKNKEIKLLMSF